MGDLLSACMVSLRKTVAERLQSEERQSHLRKSADSSSGDIASEETDGINANRDVGDGASFGWVSICRLVNWLSVMRSVVLYEKPFALDAG